MLENSFLRDDSLAGSWALSPKGSSVHFTSKTLWGLVPVKGRFTDISGRGEIADGGGITGQLTIRVASVDTGITKRDKHLRAADFFDAERFPEIAVTVAGLSHSGGQVADLDATLTIHGVTLPLPLTVTITGVAANEIQLSTRTAIDRTRWGVGGNPLGMLPTTTAVKADLIFVR